jgi:predicted MFS family arabinose efflux permease
MAPAESSFRHRFGFWAAAYAFLAVLAFSTAPSPLYVLYAHRDHFSSLMITLIYAAYAAGVAGSLFFASHLSDVHGRRPHLLAAVALALVSGVLFIVWPALPGLFTARILCGLAVGLTVSTATAYLSESHRAHRPGAAGTRPQFVAAAANLGGLSLGALLTGLLAQYAGHPLVLPYLVLLGMLGLAGIAVALSPETRDRQHPLPAYRPQRASAPEGARPQFAAALVGVFLAYTGPAVFIGLAGTFLATAVHDTSLAMAGLSIFVVFTVGVALLAVTGTWPARRLLAVGMTLEIIGLALVVTAAWLPVPSLVLFLIGGGVVGAAAATLFKGTLGIVVAVSPAGKLGEALAGFFLCGYVGLSIPAIAVGIALQSVTPRGTLLAFAIVVSAGILAASPLLLARRLQPSPAQPVVPASPADQQHSRLSRS